MIGNGDTFESFAIVVIIYFLWWTFCTSSIFRWFRWLGYLICGLFCIAFGKSSGRFTLDCAVLFLIIWHPAWLWPIMKRIFNFIKERIPI